MVGEAKPIVFLGPSLALDRARSILDADYRRPVRRGDLDPVGPGAVVALIDGVFDQDLAVSLREVHDATSRGVIVFGGASMGALRAAEVPAVTGVGRIHQWYRDGTIQRDDEVALLFDEETGRALTTPTVNVRFAVERLARSGTIDRPTADAILAATIALPYVERTYPAILRRAGLAGRVDSADLVELLLAHDLKALDAQAVLEAVQQHRDHPAQPDRHRAPPSLTGPGLTRPDDRTAEPGAADEVLIWESGDRVDFGALVEFLALTGRLEPVIRRVLASDRPPGTVLAPEASPEPGAAQAMLVEAARRWGWLSPEEAEVTLADLGLATATLDRRIGATVAATVTATANARNPSPALLDAVRAELFLDDMALKREAMRLASLRAFAQRDPGPPTAQDEQEAHAVLCRANRADTMTTLRHRWTGLGLAPAAQTDFVTVVARARRAARPLAAAMRGQAGTGRDSAPPALLLGSRPKPPGEPRSSLAGDEASTEARRLAGLIGVTRIGLIGELSELGGVQISQVARPGGGWSSSYGSGKALTTDGAVVGGVMEELEKWAQERFAPDRAAVVHGSYDQLGSDDRFVDPTRLDLPYDSTYSPDRRLRWYPCADLLAGGEVHLPLDVLTMDRLPGDICHSARGMRKHLATNGLGAAFSVEEAVLHGLCEYVERHALRLAELFLVNPGGLGPHPYRFIDLSSAPSRVRDLAARLAANGWAVRVLDITSDVAVPTFLTVLIRDGRRAEGSATHPDVGTAMERSMLEAAQTVASAVAGAREDLTIHARSLGRHERPRPVDVDDLWFWLDPDAVTVPADAIAGFASTDIGAEVDWVLDRLAGAGLSNCCVVDLSRDEVAPARVVRVIVPGLESNNPFFTGERARLVLLRDLLPRWR